MKTIKLTALAGAFMLLVLAAPQRSHAASVNIGAATWYAWWRPSFIDAMTGRLEQKTNSFLGPVRVSMHPEFLLGPALSVSFSNRWTLSTVFLYGDWYRIHTRSIKQETSSTSVFYNDMTVRKWDLDSLASYALLDFLKVFAGVKWQGYLYQVIGTYNNGNRMRLLNNSVGPGLGFAITLPLVGNFFLLWNASALYLYTRMDFGVPQSHHEVYSAFGCNSTLSVAWHLASAGTTISLGFRYQYLDYRLWAGRSSNWNPRGSSEVVLVRDILTKDHFYGILLSAVYSFNI
jgi:hypothetical protein